ncbi:MAG: hypothetical protein GXP55_12275 [Deltaproteobacteria bacterium]|nr:hypothetical protein [Deltaproteobacteria bacterium]
MRRGAPSVQLALAALTLAIALPPLAMARAYRTAADEPDLGLAGRVGGRPGSRATGWPARRGGAGRALGLDADDHG